MKPARHAGTVLLFAILMVPVTLVAWFYGAAEVGVGHGSTNGMAVALAMGLVTFFLFLVAALLYFGN